MQSNTRIKASEQVPWYRVAIVSSMVSFSIPTFVTGLELYEGLSLNDLFLAIVVGAILLTLVGGLIGTTGAATGMNSYQLSHTIFGKKGAAILNIAFACSLVGWFGINLDLFSASINRVASATLRVEFSPILIEAIAGIGMTLTSLFGFAAINRLASGLVPIMLLVTVAIAVQSGNQLSVDSWLDMEKPAHMSFSDGVSVIVGVIIIGAIILPDITRFSRQARGGVYTAFWSYGVVQTLVLIIAAFSAAAFATFDILDVLLALGIGASVLVVVIAGSWVLNSLNVYSAQLAISESFPVASPKVITVVMGVLGMFAAFANILDHFVTFLSVLTAVFVPVGGIIACDYWLLDKTKYDSDDYRDDANLPALIAWLAGALIAITTQFFALPSLTQVSALDAMLLTAVVYWLLARNQISAPVADE